MENALPSMKIVQGNLPRTIKCKYINSLWAKIMKQKYFLIARRTLNGNNTPSVNKEWVFPIVYASLNFP